MTILRLFLRLIQVGLLMTLITEHILEFICYIMIFLHIRKHNIEVAYIITEQEFKRRHKQNILTFYNQFALFLVEVGSIATMVFAVLFPSVRPIIGLFVSFNPVLTVATCLTSAPLRKIAMEMLKHA